MKKPFVVKAVRYAILIITAFLALFPFVMIVNISLKSKSEFMVDPLGLASNFHFENLATVFVKADIPKAFLNSILISFLSVLFQILFGSMAAYGLTKMRFRKAGLFSGFFLAPMVFPIQTVFIPLYIMFLRLRMVNTYHGVIIIYAAMGLPLSIFMFSGFMRTIPLEISESALVDGAGHFTIYRKLIIPLLKPVTATTIIAGGINVWNDFFLPSVMLSKREMRTLPLAIYNFTDVYGSNWPLICTCIIFVVIPVIVIYAFLQRQIISGMVAGSVKG